MAQEISLVGAGDKFALPAHLAARFGQAPSNIITDSRAATLGIRAKKFTLTVGGESQTLSRKDPDTGDDVPIPVLPVVILDYAVKMGRSYYDSAFDPDVQSQPTCWSLDGVVPEPEVVEKQSARCTNCPMAVKGSKMGANDTPQAACSVHRILSVVPVKKLDLPPLQLRIAQTSDYDGKNAEAKGQGYFAFKQYLEALKSRGIPSTRAIVTNLSFDNSGRISYPKLFFRANRWLEEEEDARVQAIMDGGKVREMLTWTGTEAAIAGEGTRPEVTAEVVERAAARSAGAQDGRFAAAEDALGEKVDTRASQKAKATAAASAKAQPKAETKQPETTPAARVTAEQVVKGTAPATFSFRDMEDGEDEDDYAIEKAQARKAFVKAQAAAQPAAKAPPAAFEPPAQEDGEDEDDYAVRVAQARKAYKAANGGAPAAKATTRKVVEAEPVPAAEEKPASSFAGMDLGGDEDEPAPAAAAPQAPAKGRGNGRAGPVKNTAAKAPTEAVAVQKVPDDVDKILGEWE